MNITWRTEAQRVIEKVCRENEGVDRVTLKNLLHKAYPFGERAYYPYRVWCEEVRIAVGEKAKPSMSELEKLRRWNENAKRFA